mmetsp:Transcript_5414/g.8092  ORF Transcript_5414/g.8092 Transcript_5414/m.8092 type:complete len:210 (+) Transcript_5414:54-683(+)
MCFFSSTTSSVSLRLVLRCLLFLGASLRLSVTSLRWLPTWVPFRSALPPPRRVPLPLCRLFTCPLMILPIQLLRPLSRILTQPLCFRETLLLSESTQLWTLLTPLLVCLTPASLVTSTTTSLALPRNSFRTTRACRTSLPSSEWMSCLKTTSSPFLAHAKCRGSCPSLSPWLKFSPEQRASSLTFLTPSRASLKFSMAITTTSLRLHFT